MYLAVSSSVIFLFSKTSVLSLVVFTDTYKKSLNNSPYVNNKCSFISCLTCGVKDELMSFLINTLGVSILTGGFPYSDVIHSEVRNSVVGLPKNLFFMVDIPLVAIQYAKPITIITPITNEIFEII